MKRIKEQNGITLIALVITVIVLLIIGGISITGGTDLINTAKAETIETNMLTIKAKAKEYIENVDSKNWALSDGEKEKENQKELKGDKYQLTLLENETGNIWYEEGYTYYKIEKQALEKMDLPELYEEGEVYIIAYPTEPNSGNLKLDIIYANGIKYKGDIYYNLSELEKAL